MDFLTKQFLLEGVGMLDNQWFNVKQEHAPHCFLQTLELISGKKMVKKILHLYLSEMVHSEKRDSLVFDKNVISDCNNLLWTLVDYSKKKMKICTY